MSYLTAEKYLQVGDSCFADSGGDGFDGRAHGVEQGCELSGPLGLTSLLQDKPGESDHIGVECTPVRHDAAAELSPRGQAGV